MEEKRTKLQIGCMIAMGGVFAFLAYLIHRAQTVIMVVRDPSPVRIVAMLCVCSMLLTSLVDNHVFNMGPGLMYSAWLVFGEKSEKTDRFAPA